MNYLLASEDFSDSAWVQVDTIVVDDALSPVGDMTADKIEELNDAQNMCLQAVTVDIAAGSTWVFSMYIKLTGVNEGDGEVTLSIGRIGGTFEGNGVVANLTSSWQRVEAVMTWAFPHTGVNCTILRNIGNPTEVHVWGAQLEQALSAGPYLKTTNSPALSELVLTGTASQINANIDNLLYTPNQGYEGIDELKVSAEDVKGAKSFLTMPIFIK